MLVRVAYNVLGEAGWGVLHKNELVFAELTNVAICRVRAKSYKGKVKKKTLRQREKETLRGTRLKR